MHDLLLSHLSSSPEAVQEQEVLYLGFTPSLSIDPSSWGRTVLFVLPRRLQFTEFLMFSQSISGRFLEHYGRWYVSTFLLLHELCLCSVSYWKITEASDRLCTDLGVCRVELTMANYNNIPNFLFGKWKSSEQNEEPALMLLSLEKWTGHLETTAMVRQEILRILLQPTMYYGKINISQWKEVWEIPIAFSGVEQTVRNQSLQSGNLLKYFPATEPQA